MHEKSKRPIALLATLAVLVVTAIATSAVNGNNPKEQKVVAAVGHTISPSQDRSAYEAQLAQERLEEAARQAAALAQAEQERLAQIAAQKARAARASARPRYAGPINDDVFIRLSWCEAGGNPTRVSRNGKYFGAFQFSLATWHGIGMSGNPIDYPYAVQLEAAKRLQARSGWGQWPVCSRKLGLR